MCVDELSHKHRITINFSTSVQQIVIHCTTGCRNMTTHPKYFVERQSTWLQFPLTVVVWGWSRLHKKHCTFWYLPTQRRVWDVPCCNLDIYQNKSLDLEKKNSCEPLSFHHHHNQILSISIGLKSISSPQKAEKDQSEALVSSVVFSYYGSISECDAVSFSVKPFSPRDILCFILYFHLRWWSYLKEQNENRFLFTCNISLPHQVHRKWHT